MLKMEDMDPSISMPPPPHGRQGPTATPAQDGESGPGPDCPAETPAATVDRPDPAPDSVPDSVPEPLPNYSHLDLQESPCPATTLPASTMLSDPAVPAQAAEIAAESCSPVMQRQQAEVAGQSKLAATTVQLLNNVKNDSPSSPEVVTSSGEFNEPVMAEPVLPGPIHLAPFAD